MSLITQIIRGSIQVRNQRMHDYFHIRHSRKKGPLRQECLRSNERDGNDVHPRLVGEAEGSALERLKPPIFAPSSFRKKEHGRSPLEMATALFHALEVALLIAAGDRDVADSLHGPTQQGDLEDGILGEPPETHPEGEDGQDIGLGLVVGNVNPQPSASPGGSPCRRSRTSTMD